MKRRQCSKCPWRVDVDPTTIPNRYCKTKHRNLRRTIANPSLLDFGAQLRVMACHATGEGNDLPCVGWLANQLGPGNNVALRLAVLQGRCSADFELVGEQHNTFEDTVP